MLAFLPTSSPHLDAAPNGDVLVALYLPQPPSPVPASIPLDQAFAGPGTFVFATTGLDINPYAAAIVSAVQNALQSFLADRAMAWILDPANITAANLAMIGFRAT